jgi:hypothetical protein
MASGPFDVVCARPDAARCERIDSV